MASRAPLRVQRYVQVGTFATRSLFHSTSFTPSSASTPSDTPESSARATQSQSHDASKAGATHATANAQEPERSPGKRSPQIWNARFSLAAARLSLFGKSASSPRSDEPRSEKPTSRNISSAGGEKVDHQPIAIAESVSRDVGRLPVARKPKASRRPRPSDVKGTKLPKFGLKGSTKHSRIPHRKSPKTSASVGKVVSDEQGESTKPAASAGDEVVVPKATPQVPSSKRAIHPKGADRKRHGVSAGKKPNRVSSRPERRLPGAALKKKDDKRPAHIQNSDGTQLTEQEVEEILRLSTQEPRQLTGKPLKEGTIEAQDVVIEEVEPLREMKIASLRTSLDRVLFNPGVHVLRDPRTGAWNFDKSVHDIPTPDEFAFHRLPQYIPPSQDKELLQLAQTSNSRFVGSTSTLTKALSQIYFAISGGKGVDLSLLSQDYAHERTTFTPGAELPAFIDIQRVHDGCYSVDSAKTWDIPNVISEFGNILEKLLTAETDDFRRFLSENPESGVPESERSVKEAYRYQKINSLLMRSQLDCHDPRLPGSGVFDIKTRACLPVRHDRANYIANAVYDIAHEKGLNNSYEREYYDLLRATMLKYSFQVRIGGMDGIFLAYHNTKRVFGFQYVPLSEIDKQIFGSSAMADQAFKISVVLLEDMLARCVQLHDGQAISVTIKHTPGIDQNSVTAYVEPKSKHGRHPGKRPVTAFTYSLQNYLDGEHVEGPVEIEDPEAPNHWTVKYSVSSTQGNNGATRRARADLDQLCNRMSRMARVSVPEGETVESMTLRDEEALRVAKDKGEVVPSVPRVMWGPPGKRQLEMRKMAKKTGQEYEERMLMWAEKEEGKTKKEEGGGEAPVAKAD